MSTRPSNATSSSRPTPAHLSECLAQPRATVMTRAGIMEYAERGEGFPLLSVHGTPGGCDQGLLLAEYFRVNGFRVIAPSRPGYLGTPLSTGGSFEQQADAMVGLLDVLAVDQAAVLGASGGGPSSYLLAARHPDRVRCLLEIDSACLPIPPSRMEHIVGSRVGSRLLIAALERFPGRLVPAFFGPSTKGRGRRELTWEIAVARALTLSVSGPRRGDGYRNDDTQFAVLAPLALTAIRAPTLIVHGTADRSVPPAHAEHAHAQIEGSELHWIAGGGHLSFSSDEQAQRHALTWMTGHMSRPAT